MGFEEPTYDTSRNGAKETNEIMDKDNTQNKSTQPYFLLRWLWRLWEERLIELALRSPGDACCGLCFLSHVLVP